MGRRIAVSAVPESLVDRIYEASVRDDGWAFVLPAITAACGAESAVLLQRDQRSGQVSFAYEHGLGTDYRQTYLTELSGADVRLADLARQPLGTVRTDTMIARYEDYTASRAYRELYSKLGTEHALGAFVFGDGARTFGLRLFRSRRRGPFGEEEIRLYQGLMPHLARTFRLRLQGRSRRQGLSVLQAVLDLLPWPVLLLNEGGAHLIGNRAAAGLAASEIAAIERLAVARAGGGAPLLGRGRRALRLDRIVLPEAWPEPQETLLLATLAAESPAVPAPALLVELYGLTPAEARLVARLAAGERLAQAAAALGIGHETARTHLRNAFAKTGTRRQLDLVRLVTLGAGVPPLLEQALRGRA